MSKNARKERRHLWWKQHGKQVEEKDEEPEEKPKNIKKHKITKKPFAKKTTDSKKKTSSPPSIKPNIEEDGLKKKARFILFVGNLPFDLEKDEILHHFRCTGGVTDFRLMTKKDGGSSKGCGFLELDDFSSYEKALNLHHSVVGGRKINVEVTCGGGGSGENRAEKLKEKKKKFRQKRGKKNKAENDKDDREKQKKSGEKSTKMKTIDKEEVDNRNLTNSKSEGRSKSGAKRKAKEDSVVSPSEPKKKKKSLKQSNAMNSLVKELELETKVQEKMEKWL